MILWLNEKLNGDDEGFTLIELMVVVLIIAILIAIAIPTFLGARRRAQDRQAQSNLRNGLTAEKTYYADAQGYTTSTTELGEIESNLDWSDDDAAARGVMVLSIGGGTGSDQAVALKSLSKSGTMFCIMDIAQNLGGTTTFLGAGPAAGTYYGKEDDGTDCDGSTSWGSTTTSWS